ncbi:(Fe-S)-binding protein [Methanobacterium sp. CWC-01]|uniref:(Fe-S)-binding protein n=1 Tax=Methanobacterium aridiramus TaxID=2584467 RepID=UPI002578E262|nr:(Fe-S)-binding protein [Methanobacterium sp. CWC-01]WJI10301.1 (Fe-S)-binding protein [Methanobacterium sp. CWC-01]
MIYFQGCTAREKLTRISKSTQELLDQAGVEYTVLDDEECCGSVLLRTGFTEDAREAMQKTYDKLQGERVVVSCAGCYRTFREDYPLMVGKVDVIHISQLLEELLSEGKLQLDREEVKVTYHDPCHLGRHLEEYESPRRVLERRGELVEMDKNREEARCCGSGGGVKSAYPELSQSMAERRVEEARKTGAELLVTCCPFCVLNLESVGKIKVRDLVEFLLGEEGS